MSSSTEPSERQAGVRSGIALSVLTGLILLGLHQYLSHWVALGPRDPATRLLPLAVPAIVAVVLAFRRGVLRGTLAVAACIALLACAFHFETLAAWLAVLPQAIVSLGVAWWFGRTLQPGREPLITFVARRVHGALPPAIETYTRQITWLWALWMTSLAVVSVALFAFGDRALWSVFANLLFFPLIALLFVLEYAYRVMRYGWFKPASLAQTVRAFHRHAGAPVSGGGPTR